MYNYFIINFRYNMGQGFDINFQTKKMSFQNDIRSMIISNQNYLSYICKDIVDIYNLYQNNFDLKYKTSIYFDNYVNHINFNPNYPQLLLTSLQNSEIKLWQISGSNEKCEEKCVFKGHSNYVQYGLFNPIFDNLIISSDNNNIKLWDITKYINVANFRQQSIKNLQWDTTGKYYGFINKNFKGLSINEKKDNETIFSIEEKINDFIFIKEDELLTFNNNIIKKWNIKQNNNKPIQTFDIKCKSNYLKDNYFNYLYFLDEQTIRIFDSFKFNIIKEKNINNFNPFYPILLDNYFLKDNTITNILNMKNNGYDIIKIENEEEVRLINKKPQKTTTDFQEYMKNVIYQISDYSKLLNYNENEIIGTDSLIKSKNYLKIDEIKNELEEIIKKESIFERKKKVEEDIKTEYIVNDIKSEYLFYLKLLIRDNTNKALIKKYLNFLKCNEQQLNTILEEQYVEKYKDEIKFYEVCFDIKEFKEYFNEIKVSEEDNLKQFLSKLVKITNEKELINFKLKEINEFKNNSFFNQPINISNKELYYYKNKIILHYDILNNDYYKYYEKFKIKQKLIKQILDKNILENNIIINNEDKFNLLIYLIIYPEDDNINEYLLNLLISNKCNDNDIKDIINKTNFKLIISNGNKFLLNGELKYDNIQYLCKDNFIIKYDKNIYNNTTNIINNKEELYCFDFLLNNSLSNDSLNKIKKFLKEILKSNVFNKLFKFLYDEKYKDFFNDNDFVNEFIENYFRFIPYKSNNNCGMTDRFSSKSYIFLDEKEILKNLSEKEIKDILKIGTIIVITVHEINHNIYSYILHFFNYLNLSFESLRKQKIYDIREGGFYIELILFGKIINEISLEEVLYILNIDNYNKSLTEFQKDFMNLKQEDIKIKGIFSELNKIIERENFENIRNISIKTKYVSNHSMKDIKIDVPMRRNCVLGCHREINIEKINDFFKNYHKIE